MEDLKVQEENGKKRNRIKSSELRGKKISIGQISFSSITTYHMLKKDGVDVSMFFDKDYRLQHRKYKDTPIFPWANFYDTYVILVTPSRYTEMKKMLIQSCGYSEDKILLFEDIQFECSELDIKDEYDWDWLIENTNNVSDSFISYRNRIFEMRYCNLSDPIVPKMAIDVNNKCTLNCEYCYAQMPYYQLEERENYNIDEIIMKFEQLLQVVDYIPYLWILGGEPLLHPQLHELILFLNSEKVQDKVIYADILTNGTLLFTEKAIKAIQENSLFWRVSISPYNAYSKKQYNLFSQLNQAGISYYSRYMIYWQKFGQIVETESVNSNLIYDKCKNCVCRNLHLVKGKLYHCPVLAHFEILDRIPYNVRNSFDCSKSYTKDELRKFIQSYSPGMAYCNGNHQTYLQDENEMNQFGGEMIPVAGQVKGVLPCKRYEYVN